MFSADIPDSIVTNQFNEDDLPVNWRNIDPSPTELQDLGDAFINNGDTAVLIVPSIIAPDDNIILLNPAHPDFSKITLLPGIDFEFDSRLGVK